MTLLHIYNLLADINIDESQKMDYWERIKMTFRIKKCSQAIQQAIYDYLETQEDPEYSLTLTFTDQSTGQPRTTTVSCADVRTKMHLQPLPALLYLDWLRREPESAAAFVLPKDSLDTPTREEIRAHADPRLLALADKARAAREKKLRSEIDNSRS